MKSIYDYKKGRVVNVWHWGKPEQMKVISHSWESQKVQLQHVNTSGSCWYTPEELDSMENKCQEYYRELNKKNAVNLWDYPYMDDTDCMGNNFSDADPGL